jgi:hypothetical protein
MVQQRQYGRLKSKTGAPIEEVLPCNAARAPAFESQGGIMTLW